MVATNLLANGFAYRVKDEKTWLSVNFGTLKCATERYEIQILETAGATVFR